MVKLHLPKRDMKMADGEVLRTDGGDCADYE